MFVFGQIRKFFRTNTEVYVDKSVGESGQKRMFLGQKRRLLMKTRTDTEVIRTKAEVAFLSNCKNNVGNVWWFSDKFVTLHRD